MSAPEEARSRTDTLRDVLIFRAKLWLKGFRDFVLMPLSMGAAVVDVMIGGSTLYAVMKLGDRFERWVHLYGALDAPEEEDAGHDSRSLDHLLNKVVDGAEHNATSRPPEEAELRNRGSRRCRARSHWPPRPQFASDDERCILTR